MAVSLRPWHTFKMSATADMLFAFDSVEKLLNTIDVLESHKTSFRVLGHGSNVVFSTHFSGWILLNRIMGIEIVQEDADYITLEVGGGVCWHQLVLQTLQRGWFGLENMISIPGTVGAAPMQNIGAYGTELADVFQSCQAVSLDTRQLKTYGHADCAFGYRTSFFKSELARGNQYVVTSVVLRLAKQAKVNLSYPRLQAFITKNHSSRSITPYLIASAVRALRCQRLPNWLKVGTVGSFFINPIISSQDYSKLLGSWPSLDAKQLASGDVKLFAGNLLTLAGFRGYRHGGLVMSAVNPIVITNEYGATTDDLLQLLAEVTQRMIASFNITLVVEPKIF